MKMNSAALLQGKLHLKQVEFTLKELVLVKNKEGKSNLDSLRTWPAGCSTDSPNASNKTVSSNYV